MNYLKLLSILAVFSVVSFPLLISAQRFPENLPNSCTLRNDLSDLNYAPNTPCGGVGTTVDFEGGGGLCCVFDAIISITMFIFWALLLLSIIFVLIGAFYIMTAGGDPGKVGTGRSFIIWAAIGFAVALAARAFPSLARAVVGL